MFFLQVLLLSIDYYYDKYYVFQTFKNIPLNISHTHTHTQTHFEPTFILSCYYHHHLFWKNLFQFMWRPQQQQQPKLCGNIQNVCVRVCVYNRSIRIKSLTIHPSFQLDSQKKNCSLCDILC